MSIDLLFKELLSSISCQSNQPRTKKEHGGGLRDNFLRDGRHGPSEVAIPYKCKPSNEGCCIIRVKACRCLDAKDAETVDAVGIKSESLSAGELSVRGRTIE